MALVIGLCAAILGLCEAILGRNSDIAFLVRVPNCATAARNGSWAIAIQVCQLEFERTSDPTTGVHLAKALNASGNVAPAKQRATSLRTTSARSDALQLLGRIAKAEGRLDDAVTDLEEARKLHRSEQKNREHALDDGALALVRTERSEFAEALQLVDECLTEAQLEDDKSLQYYCHLVAARPLIQAGYFAAAKKELEIATPLAASDHERADLAYQRGNYEQELGHHAMAIVRFQEALRLDSRSPDINWTIITELNVAYSLAEQGRIDDAQHHLENATLLDSDHKQEAERTWTAAQIAYRQRDLTSASSLTEKYFTMLGADDSADRDDQIDVATLQAQIELERNELGRAELWARRAVDQAEFVRRAQSVLELRPWVLEKRHVPYELLFIALARSGKVECAAMVFDEWQGRTVQDALARPRLPASLDHRDIIDQVTRLDRWLHVASQATFFRSPDPKAVLSTMRGIDLLALIVANGDLWRLTANHGSPRLSRLGKWAELKGLVDQFRGHPLDVKVGARLGALLLPDDTCRATSDVLHVLLDGQLGGLSMAALCHGVSPATGIRPIVRMLRLPETRCVHAPPAGHATVLADPDGKLSNARAEGERVAELLDTTSKTGTAATKDALFAAANDAVLHIAAHGTIGMDGAVIELADREVSALEISARRLAPSLAVLSTCDAATSDDAELARSLAAGFLAAGSQHVVATLRQITDAGAPDISTRFYRAGGIADPARALAAVQSELAKTATNIDWPYFTVFGPDVCAEGAPDHR